MTNEIDAMLPLAASHLVRFRSSHGGLFGTVGLFGANVAAAINTVNWQMMKYK